MNPSRRRFVKNSVKIAAATSIISAIPSQVSCSNPNQKIVVAGIGLRSQGWANLNGLLQQANVECGALCDIDARILKARSEQVEKEYQAKPVLYKDFRKLLENKDIDAVVIGTPDHWHCLITVMALEAGKHVYVEKPMANSIEEARIMARAAAKHRKLVVTVGQWQRSGRHWQDAMEYVHSGELGTISRVKAWSYTGKPKLAVVPDGPAPEGVDYDMWLGPAEKRPFNKNRFHYNFRYFWDYAGGLMTDWGVHMLDYAMDGMNAITPNSIVASGGRFSYPDGARQTPDTLNIGYEFDDFTINWEHSVNLGISPEGLSHGVMFQGTNGNLLVNRNGWKVNGERLNKEEKKLEEIPHQSGTGGFTEHLMNFLDGIRLGTKPHCPVERGRDVAIFAHMGNIAYRTGNKLIWDPSKGMFLDNQEANDLITPTYRKPWMLPEY